MGANAPTGPEVLVLRDRRPQCPFVGSPSASARPRQRYGRAELRPARSAITPAPTRYLDARVEVVDLIARTGLIDVDSDEPERASAHAPVGAAEDALHEAHVRVEERKLRDLARRVVRALDGAADIGEADDAIEVGDRARLGRDRVETRGPGTIDVKATAKHWSSARDRQGLARGLRRPN